jgi:hypothetical protein
VAFPPSFRPLPFPPALVDKTARAHPPARLTRPQPGGGAGALDEKSAARARVALIKERIEALRQMLLMLGGKVSASVLNELRQLSGELAAAAAALAAAGGGASPSATSTLAQPAPATAESTSASASAHDGSAVGEHDAARAAYAEQQQAADAAGHAGRADDAAPGQASGTMAKRVTAATRDAAHDADEHLVESVWRRLRSTLALAESLEEQRRTGVPSA